jgi:hypothetical protein
MAAKRKPWSEAHAREARRRTYELAAELAGDDRGGAAWLFVADVRESASYRGEELWRESLGSHFDPARVNAEVRRVRGLAEGRIVRETVWRDGRIVRVQRIRRARAT